MPPALPLELTDAIIDHLHADHTALTACSLAQGDPPQIEGAIASSSPQGACSEGAAQTGDEKNVFESFATRVHEVWVRGPQPELTMMFSVETMVRILVAFPNLHTLHLHRVALTPSDAAHARGMQGVEGPQALRRYRLRWLDLAVVYQADTEWLAAILELYAELQELTLQCVCSAGDWPDVNSEEERTRCESLVIDGLLPNSFGVWRSLQLDGLKACEVKFMLPEHGRIVCEMLGAAAGSLESLRLVLFSIDPVSVWEPLSVIPWSALTRLSLVFEIYNGDRPLSLTPINVLVSYLPQTISTIELRIDETPWPLATLQFFGWDGLEAQLLRLSNLRSLAIHFCSGQPDRERTFLETAIKEMPTLAGRGLLAAYQCAECPGLDGLDQCMFRTDFV